MDRKWKRVGQSTAEYAVLFAIIVGAVVAMQIFVKRAVQAKQKDGLMFYLKKGLNVPNGTKLQYEPYYDVKNIQQFQTTKQKKQLKKGFAYTSRYDFNVNYGTAMGSKNAEEVTTAEVSNLDEY